jgi:F420-dependent oxidoreductase-like protein
MNRHARADRETHAGDKEETLKVGLIMPQGWTGEYDGWDPREAWERTAQVARRAEELGFESIWVFDHFHTVPEPTDEITFEAFTTLSTLIALTERVRLGHIVACASYRNPALVAKMVSTMDVMSGGRMELGIGAGWKEDEWRAYGYGFPPTRERLEALGDALEIVNRMMAPGHATYEGKHFSVRDAINEPKPLQEPRVPITVGGNGPNVTWRLAAKHADELNLDGMPPSDVRDALPVIRRRCEEIDRDPATLRVSVHIWLKDRPRRAQPVHELLAEYRELGVSRVMTLLPGIERGDEVLDDFARDVERAGGELRVPAAA